MSFKGCRTDVSSSSDRGRAWVCGPLGCGPGVKVGFVTGLPLSWGESRPRLTQQAAPWRPGRWDWAGMGGDPLVGDDSFAAAVLLVNSSLRLRV